MSDHSRENTGEITCPHCDYEFEDSWDCIPSNSDGEVTWKETCPDCEKEFNASFDCRNVDDGYSTHVLNCETGEHDYQLWDKCYKSNFERRISAYSRIDVCTICDDYRFTPVKEDGSDFTKKELLDFKIKKRLEKKDKKLMPFDGAKTGEFKYHGNIEITLTLNEPEGNVKIWVQLCRWMKTKGFEPQKLPDYLRSNKVSFKRGWLECEVSLHDFAIGVKFYQNEILKDRKKGDGRYEYNAYNILTTQMKLQVRASMNMIKKYFISNGFEFKQEETDCENLLSRLKVDNLEDWKDPEANHYSRDKQDRNKKLMKSGEEKYFYSGTTLKRGVIWWNNGNQWYVMCNGTLSQASHFNLFDYNNEPARKPLTKDQQIQRLHTELTKAEKSHNYDKCKVLWSKLQSHRLYNVFSKKHNTWWCGNDAGYTPNKANAGIYTHENIMSKQSYYNNGVDSIAIEIIN